MAPAGTSSATEATASLCPGSSPLASLGKMTTLSPRRCVRGSSHKLTQAILQLLSWQGGAAPWPRGASEPLVGSKFYSFAASSSTLPDLQGRTGSSGCPPQPASQSAAGACRRPLLSVRTPAAMSVAVPAAPRHPCRSSSRCCRRPQPPAARRPLQS